MTKEYVSILYHRAKPYNVLRVEQYRRLTKSQLDEWGCKYHFLELGNKPQFDLFIDDKAKRIEEI